MAGNLPAGVTDSMIDDLIDDEEDGLWECYEDDAADAAYEDSVTEIDEEEA